MLRSEGENCTMAWRAGGEAADDFFELVEFEELFCVTGHGCLKTGIVAWLGVEKRIEPRIVRLLFMIVRNAHRLAHRLDHRLGDCIDRGDCIASLLGVVVYEDRKDEIFAAQCCRVAGKGMDVLEAEEHTS